MAGAFRYVMRSETEPVIAWVPSGVELRGRLSDRVSLATDYEAFRTDTVESQRTSPEAATSEARRTFLTAQVALMAHLADYAYVQAGVGGAYEVLETRYGNGLWNEARKWRPRAFVGSGLELRRGRLGVDFEARAVALGGSGPTPRSDTPMSMIETPEVSHFAVQGSIALVMFVP